MAALVLLAGAVAACENPTVAPPRADAAAGPRLNHTPCAAAANQTPANGLLSAQPVKLRFLPDGICRWVDRVQIYDDATSALVVDDTEPEYRTYQMGSEYEYRTTALQRGRYYRWRVRMHEKSASLAILQYSPWSSEVRFGVALLAPSVSSTLSGFYPSLSWPAVEGASHYVVLRVYQNNVAYGWDWYDQEVVTGTSYTEPYMCTTTSGPTGHTMSYWVTAVSASGISSPNGSGVHYSVCGQAPY